MVRGFAAQVAALAVLGVAALGCSDSDRPPPLGSPEPIAGCDEFSYQPCDILASECQRELFALAACLRGEPEQTEPPPVRVLDEASALAVLTEAAAGDAMTEGLDMMADPTLGEAEFRAQVRGLELLGLLEPGLIADESDVLEVTFSALIAYYLTSTQEIIVVDRGGALESEDANTTLVHEFVHALQDRRHGLAAVGADVDSSDSDLALSSLIEGEASLYQYLVAFAYEGLDLRRANFNGFFAALMNGGTEATLEAGSPAVTAGSIFPYSWGTRYAGQVWLSGGSSALDARYAAPPRTSWEVVAGSAAGAPPSIRTFEEVPEPIEGYAFVAEDVAGAWIASAVLPGLSGQQRNALPDLASRWRGDHLWLYDAADAPAVAALWAIDWEDEEAATRFASLAEDLAPDGAVLHIDTQGASTRVVAVERAEDLEAWQARLAAGAP